MISDLLLEEGIELLEANIGGGGSAVVHRCQVASERADLPQIGTALAVKEYRETLLRVDGQLDRVRQEARLGVQLQHPNLVRTHKLIEVQREDGSSVVFLVLEWIDGETLEQWHRRVKGADWEAIRGLALGVTAGLEELHRNRVLHRDIKPENVMVRRTGTAVLMDIGVAELTSDNEHTLHTAVKDFVGSVRFASPQFIMGEQYTQADDVYSVGATLFLLFTGRQIYSEVERKPVLPIVVTQGPPRIESLASTVPASIKLLLEGMLHRDRARRPSLTELKQCLTDPDNAQYITTELEKQAAESRTYQVIGTSDSGGALFADLAGDTPEVDEHYTVVRPGKRLTVPSYNRDVAPEIWIANAVLKHVHGNVGHFIVTRSVWKDVRPTVNSFSNYPAANGFWTQEERVTSTVSKGDFVLKKNA